MINWVDCLLRKKKKWLSLSFTWKRKKKKMGVGRKPSGLKHLLIGFTNMETLQFNIRKIILDDKATVCLNFKGSPLFIISIFLKSVIFLGMSKRLKMIIPQDLLPKGSYFFSVLNNFASFKSELSKNSVIVITRIECSEQMSSKNELILILYSYKLLSL